jgi:hypothetical protein
MNADRCHLQMLQAQIQVQLAQLMRQRNEDVIVLNRAADQDFIATNSPVFNGSDPVKFQLGTIQ